jgi:hypothetical protein
MNFMIVFSIPVRNFIEILMKIALNLSIAFSNIVILEVPQTNCSAIKLRISVLKDTMKRGKSQAID